jgi:hypothetical protein
MHPFLFDEEQGTSKNNKWKLEREIINHKYPRIIFASFDPYTLHPF